MYLSVAFLFFPSLFISLQMSTCQKFPFYRLTENKLRLTPSAEQEERGKSRDFNPSPNMVLTMMMMAMTQFIGDRKDRRKRERTASFLWLPLLRMSEDRDKYEEKDVERMSVIDVFFLSLFLRFLFFLVLSLDYLCRCHWIQNDVDNQQSVYQYAFTSNLLLISRRLGLSGSIPCARFDL